MRLLKQQQKLWSPLYRGPKIDIPRDCYWTCFYKNKKLRDSKKVFYFEWENENRELTHNKKIK